jgi:hypothetical protein
LVFGGATQVNARSVIDRSAAVLLQPHLYFTCDDDFMDFGDGSVYVVIMAILAALLAIVIGNEGSPYLSIGLVPALLIGPLAGVLATFVMAGIIQILCKAVGSLYRGFYAHQSITERISADAGEHRLDLVGCLKRRHLFASR